MTKKSILDFARMKKDNEKAAWVTAYDFPMAMFAEKAEMDMILVGDSMGMVLLGYKDTIPVTMDDCLSHCRAVRRGAPQTWIVGDMPFGSYQVSDENAVINAVRFLKEGQVDCVKLEGGVRVSSRIKAINDAGILVMGHIGLTPQSSGQLGGFRATGRDVVTARALIEDALAVEEAGAYSILIEAVAPELTAFLTKRLEIPVYSIGAGSECDGQLLICGDMLGQFQAFTPKFVKVYADIAETSISAFKQYREEVKSGMFPTEEHVYPRKDSLEDFQKLFKEFS